MSFSVVGVHGDVHCVQVDDLLEADCDDVGVAGARVRVGEEPGAHGVGGACEVKLRRARYEVSAASCERERRSICSVYTDLLGVDVPCGALDVYRGELCEFGLAGCELLQDPSLVVRKSKGGFRMGDLGWGI